MLTIVNRIKQLVTGSERVPGVRSVIIPVRAADKRVDHCFVCERPIDSYIAAWP